MSKNRTYRRIIPYFWIIRETFRKEQVISSDEYLGNNIYLYFYRINSNGSFTDNLGDFLSKVIVSFLLSKTERKNNNSCSVHTLYAIGSILGFRVQNAVVWGSGLLSPDHLPLLSIKLSKLDIRAVRGPNTREQLIRLGKNCPEIFGDPAVLMPLVFSPKILKKIYDVSIIFNSGHKDFSLPDNSLNVIETTTTDYERFITQILQSQKIISSSLHGIILAETYGVPAVLLLHENQSTFKYEDWYYSTGRFNIMIAHSIDEALLIEPMELPDLKNMQTQLLKSFPYDLWR